jgi:hypothetical protein
MGSLRSPNPRCFLGSSSPKRRVSRKVGWPEPLGYGGGDLDPAEAPAADEEKW